MTGNEERKLRVISASAILAGMILPWLSWLTIDHIAESKQTIQRVTSVEQKTEFNKETLKEIKEAILRVEGKLDKKK